MRVILRQPPALYTDAPPPASYFRFGITPGQTIAVGTFVKVAGETLRGEQVELVVSEHRDAAEMGAYEELLSEAGGTGGWVAQSRGRRERVRWKSG